MNDFVYEELFRRDHGKLGKIFPFVSYLAFASFTLIFNYLVLRLYGNYIYISGMISFGLWYLVYRLNCSLKVDYEVTIVNDSVEITKIIAERKRYGEINFSIRENCEYIGPVTTDKANKCLMDSDRIINTTTYSPYKDVDTNWCFFVNQAGQKNFVIFEFKPSMYKNLRRYCPRNTESYTYPEGWEEEYE